MNNRFHNLMSYSHVSCIFIVHLNCVHAPHLWCPRITWGWTRGEAVSETTCGMEESGSDEGEVTSWHARCKTNIIRQE